MNQLSRKIILLGVGPIPPQKALKTYAPGWYSWTLAKLIRNAGHLVYLGLGSFPGGDEDDRIALAKAELGENIEGFDLPLDPETAAPVLQRQSDRIHPDAFVVYTDVMANTACRVRTSAPRYFIFYGHPMAERQMQATVGGCDIALIDMWAMIMPALLGGDRFGATSRAQQSAMLGELGALGRMNRHNVNNPPVDHLPVPIMNVKQTGTPGRIKGSLVPNDAFIVLWLGGYNTWSDEKTLFDALELAMADNPHIHYVSCGGEIKGHVEQTYANFCERVSQSPHANRYHLVGWKRWDELGDYFADADCAICTDLPTLEGRFGARTRILDLLLNEVPVITNATDEATYRFASDNLLSLHPPGDPKALSDGILELMRQAEESKRKAVNISNRLQETLTPEKQWAPLLDWLEAPQCAEDLTVGLEKTVTSADGDLPYHIRIADNSLSLAQAHFLTSLIHRNQPHVHQSLADRLKNKLKKMTQ